MLAATSVGQRFSVALWGSSIRSPAPFCDSRKRSHLRNSLSCHRNQAESIAPLPSHSFEGSALPLPPSVGVVGGGRRSGHRSSRRGPGKGGVMRRAEYFANARDPKTMTVGQVMEDAVFTVSPDTKGITIAEIMTERNFGTVPVVTEDLTLVGLVSEFDLLRVIDEGKDLRQVTGGRDYDQRCRLGHRRDAGHGFYQSPSRAASRPNSGC